MNEKNLEFNEEENVYIDKYNGISYIKINNDFVPLVAGGLPAELETHNGKNYLVNNMGTYEIIDGKANFEPLQSTLDASPLFFGEDGKLHSEYNDYAHEVVDGKPIALYDTENNLPAEIRVNENGEKFLVSEQGEYRITEGMVMTPTEERIAAIKEVEKEFLSDEGRCATFLASSPEQRKEMLDKFKREHGVEEIVEESQDIEKRTELEGIPDIEECCEGVALSEIEEGVTQMQQGVNEQEALQNQTMIEEVMPEI